jgi:hypothetical protein
MSQGKLNKLPSTFAKAALSADDMRALTSRLRRAEGQVRAVARLM